MNKDNLIFTYQWTSFATDEANVSGCADSTFFNRNEGHEMLFLISTIMDAMGVVDKSGGQRIEFLLKKHLPRTILTQWHAKSWVEANWSNSFSCYEPMVYSDYFG